MGFIPASFLVYLVHEKSSNGKCGIQEHQETGNEGTLSTGFFRHDFMTPVMRDYDVNPETRRVKPTLARHQQLLTGGGAYGFVKKVQNMQNFIQHASGKQ